MLFISLLSYLYCSLSGSGMAQYRSLLDISLHGPGLARYQPLSDISGLVQVPPLSEIFVQIQPTGLFMPVQPSTVLYRSDMPLYDLVWSDLASYPKDQSKKLPKGPVQKLRYVVCYTLPLQMKFIAPEIILKQGFGHWSDMASYGLVRSYIGLIWPYGTVLGHTRPYQNAVRQYECGQAI